MTNIRIALTNLGKYNEGELLYTWLDLPATDEEISEAFEEIQVAPNTRYEEHFISDYEAPFEIGEYANIERLNEVAEVLENVKVPTANEFGVYKPEDVINFAMNLGNDGLVSNADELVQDIVSDDLINENVRHYAEQGEWERVKFFLLNADVQAEFHWINGYGNVETLTNDRLSGIVSNLIDALRHELL
jgi:hypothetical protein